MGAFAPNRQRSILAIKEYDMKTTAYILEYIEGSDDPRAIEGGGGSKWRLHPIMDMIGMTFLGHDGSRCWSKYVTNV